MMRSQMMSDRSEYAIVRFLRNGSKFKIKKTDTKIYTIIHEAYEDGFGEEWIDAININDSKDIINLEPETEVFLISI